MRLPAAWRVRSWTWAVPLAFVLANGAVLALHPGRSGAGFEDMRAELASESEVLASLVEKKEALERVLEEARASRRGLAELYERHFSTEAEQLTRVITEVKRLARRAGFEPPSIAYPHEEIEELGLIRKSLVFQVEGSYTQLRTLVNLLEVSELFLILEDVRLRDVDEARLGIALTVTTLFAADTDERPRRGRGLDS